MGLDGGARRVLCWRPAPPLLLQGGMDLMARKKADETAASTTHSEAKPTPKKTAARKPAAESEAGDAEAALRRIHELTDQVRHLVETAVEHVDQHSSQFEQHLDEHLAAVRRRSAEVQLELGATLNHLDTVSRHQQTL